MAKQPKPKIILPLEQYEALCLASEDSVRRHVELDSERKHHAVQTKQLQDALALVQRNREEEIADRDKQLENLKTSLRVAIGMRDQEIADRDKWIVDLQMQRDKAYTRNGELLLLEADAELGRLVRAMPAPRELKRWPQGWSVSNIGWAQEICDTPEEALRAAGVSVPTEPEKSWQEQLAEAIAADPAIKIFNACAFEESVHQQAKAGMSPIEGDPRTGSADGFPAEYARQHGHEKQEAGK